MHFFLILIFCFGANFLLQAQSNHQFKITSFSDEKNIPSMGFYHGVEDSQGLLWFSSTNGGIYRYDGIGFKEYPIKNEETKGMQNKDLFIAPDQMLWLEKSWVGEKQCKVLIFDPIEKSYTPFREYFRNKIPFDDPILGLVKNKDGTIGITTTSYNSYEYNGKDIISLPSALNDIFSTTSVLKIYKFSDTLYARLVPGAIEFRNAKGKILQYRKYEKEEAQVFFVGLPNEVSNSVYLTGRLASEFTITRHGLNKKPKICFRASYINEALSKKNNFTLNAYQNKLFITSQDSLYIYGSKMNLISKYAIYIRQLICVDSQHGIWYLDESSQLKRLYYQSSPFDTYACDEFANCPRPSRGIVEGNHNDLLIANLDNILYIDSAGHKYSIFPSEGLLGDLFGIIMQKNKQNIWIADNTLLVKISPDNIHGLARFPILSSDMHSNQLIWQPYEDKEGRIWLGASEGLFFFNPKDSTIKIYQPDSSYQAIQNKCSVFHFYENKEGMWLCTSKGLFFINPKTQTLEHFKDNFKTPIVHLHEDKDGTFWLATKGMGLVHWSKKEGILEQFDSQTGLEDDVVYAVYQDSFERFWLPSNNGLICFDKNTRNSFNYTLEDGLPNLEFNTISHYKGADEKLYFGTIAGAIGFYPNRIPPSDKAFELLISEFRKWDKNDNVVHTNSIDINSNGILFTPNDKRIELSFFINNYNNPKQNHYTYKIEGFDRDWQLLEKPTIKITALPYGNYKLKLRAKAAKGFWQEKIITLDVIKPFYLQWWFIVLSIIGLIGIVYAFFRWRIQRLEQAKTVLENTIAERTQEISQQAEELKKLDKVKSRFFANISHELRTPLTLILGPVSNIKQKPKEIVSPEELHKTLDIVNKNSKHLLALVEEILDLSKLDAQKFDVNLQVTALHTFVSRVFSAFESIAQINGIQYNLLFFTSKDTTVLLDKNKVERILNNFLSNAFKFTPKYGSIKLIIEVKDNMIIFSVQDSGKGISKDDLPHVFERFFQSKSPELKAQGGTGVGLALCHEFATLLKGKVWVDSQIGKGSHFYCQLPLLLTDKILEEAGEPLINGKPLLDNWAPEQVKTNTILLVEDNPDMQDFVHSILAPFYTVITANNGLLGLEQLQENHKHIDLIISDVMMPEMDGFAMLEQIKVNDYWRSIPLIMLTARTAEQDKLKALTIGANDYLLKPFSTNELLARVKNLLDNYAQRKLWHQELMQAAKTLQRNQPETAIPNKEKTTRVAVVSKQDLEWLKEIEVQIAQQLAQEFTIEQLAQQAFLSKKQLERKIKHITGFSPAKLIKEIRLQKARELLTKGVYNTISEVSLAVGFQTPKYFSRVYKERFGKAPREYF